MPEPIVADVLAVRLFEVVAFGLFAFGWWYALRTRSMIVLGGYVGATLTVVFDWMFNTKWFFNVLYSSNFIPLFRIGDTVQPVALLFTYAFFFGIPTAFLARNRAWLDRRFGTWGWLVVFLGMGCSNRCSRYRWCRGCTCGPTIKPRSTWSAASSGRTSGSPAYWGELLRCTASGAAMGRHEPLAAEPHRGQAPSAGDRGRRHLVRVLPEHPGSAHVVVRSRHPMDIQSERFLTRRRGRR